MKHPFKRVLLAALVLAASTSAMAHDSWFARVGSLGDGEPLLALGTGNQFPKFEFAIDPPYLSRQGCRWVDGQVGPMEPVRVGSTALVLRPGQPGATTCWAQLQPFDIDVKTDKIEPYLAEINATPALRSSWAAMQSRGVPWKERYTKHARIELQATPHDPKKPADMAVDLHRVSGPEPGNTRAGDTLVFELHRNGQPMVGVQLELRHTLSVNGVWHETDAQGRVSVTPTVVGDWLLRGVDLRLSATKPDQWESDFVTLAFTVLDKR